MAHGIFTYDGIEVYNPNYGGIEWKRRLNGILEASGIELKPLYYHEPELPTMQITQENTIIARNRVASELDSIIVKYDHDEDISTYFFRESLPDFEDYCSLIGVWAMHMQTLYPLEVVVESYEQIHTRDIPDTFNPDDFLPRE